MNKVNNKPTIFKVYRVKFNLFDINAAGYPDKQYNKVITLTGAGYDDIRYKLLKHYPTAKYIVIEYLTEYIAPALEDSRSRPGRRIGNSLFANVCGNSLITVSHLHSRGW